MQLLTCRSRDGKFYIVLYARLSLSLSLAWTCQAPPCQGFRKREREIPEKSKGIFFIPSILSRLRVHADTSIRPVAAVCLSR